LIDARESAYRLQAEAERLLGALGRQHDIALRLRHLANDQREVTSQWETLATDDLLEDARRVEADLRALSMRLVTLETEIVDRIAAAMTAASRVLHGL
jgi:hypothetical protein